LQSVQRVLCFFVTTVGGDEESIRAYLPQQEIEDACLDQLTPLAEG